MCMHMIESIQIHLCAQVHIHVCMRVEVGENAWVFPQMLSTLKFLRSNLSLPLSRLG